MFNWLKKVIHQHEWEETYTYSSFKDGFSNGFTDVSGIIYIGQKCKCRETRTIIRTYNPKGSLDKEVIRTHKVI